MYVRTDIGVEAKEVEKVSYYDLDTLIIFDGHAYLLHDDAPAFPSYLMKAGKLEDIIIEAEEEMVVQGLDPMHKDYVEEVLTKALGKRLRKADKQYARQFASMLHRWRYSYGPITAFFLSKEFGFTDVVVHVGSIVEAESYKYGKFPTNVELDRGAKRHLVSVIGRYVAPVSAYNPYASQVDYRYRIRVTVAAPPVASDYTMAFRLLGRATFTPPAYVAYGGATPEQMALLWDIWVRGRNGKPAPIIIIGEPGTGKTTAADVIISTTPPDKPLAVVESVQEISAPQARVRLVERHSFSVDIPEVRMRQLIQVALRMSVPYVATNEVLGAEDAQALIHAATIGMATITTIHAATPEDLLHRLKSLGVPTYAVRYIAKNAVVVKMAKKGTRRFIAEIWFSDGKGGWRAPTYDDYLRVQDKAKILAVLSNARAYYNPEDWLLFLREYYENPQRALARVVAME